MKEMAETDLIIPQSDIKIELLAKEILKDFKISLGQNEYNIKSLCNIIHRYCQKTRETLSRISYASF